MHGSDNEAVLGQVGAERKCDEGSVPLPSIRANAGSQPRQGPISLLQEYGTRMRKAPVYDLLKAEGQAHQPNFTFRVTVGDTSCTGEEAWATWLGCAF